MQDLLQRIAEAAAVNADVAALAVLVCAALIVSQLALIRIRALTTRLDETEARNERLQLKLALQGDTLMAYRATIAAMDTRVRRFTNANLEFKSQLATITTFERASRMLRDGESAADLVDACGLNDVEADLMARLHNRSDLKEVHAATAAEAASAEPPSAEDQTLDEQALQQKLRASRA